MNNKKLILPLFVIILVSYFFYNHVYNPYVYIAKNGTKYHTSSSPYYQAHTNEYIKKTYNKNIRYHIKYFQKIFDFSNHIAYNKTL